jgi:GAF domain-containing protein
MIESISGELALAPLIERILESAVELLAAQHGSIGLAAKTSAGPVVRIVAIVNMPPQELGAEHPAGVGLAGRVLRDQRPFQLDRYGDLGLGSLPALADHAVIGVPIWWAGQLIGYIGLGSPPPRRFADDEIETLALLARHAAIAIENARRYERERRRIEQLALIARIGRTLTADLPLDELLQSAADAIHELLGYPNVAIPLIDPDDPTTLVIQFFGGAYRTIVGGVHRQPNSYSSTSIQRRVCLRNTEFGRTRLFACPLRQVQDERQHGTYHFICISVFALAERKNRNTKEDEVPLDPSRHHCQIAGQLLA